MKSQRRIPTTLQDCLRIGTVPQDLLQFADLMEKWGKIIFYTLIVSGIVMIITAAIAWIDIGGGVLGIILAALVIALIVSIPAAIVWVIFRLLATLIRSMALLTENSSISTNLALMHSWKAEYGAPQAPAKKKAAPQPATPPAATPPAVAPQPTTPPVSEASAQPESKVEVACAEDGSWLCPSCGQRNLATRRSCWRCDHHL